MCRNIRTLHNFEPPASRDEVHGAALQYVRKISGATKPSQANQEAFDQAVVEVEAATRPMTYQDFVAHGDNQRRYWARAHLGWSRMGSAEPNDGHRALTRLETAGRV